MYKISRQLCISKALKIIFQIPFQKDTMKIDMATLMFSGMNKTIGGIFAKFECFLIINLVS